MNNYNVIRNCSLLDDNKTFENLFNIICAYGDVVESEWIENGVIKRLTFNEQRLLTDNYSVYFKEHFESNGIVCISLDSCKEWFPIFWGLLRSGHDVLAVDANADDNKVQSLMKQTGCSMLVGAKRRNIDCNQVLVADVACAKVVTDYKPVWGKRLALCTSGTMSDSRIFVYNEDTVCKMALFSKKVYMDNKRLIDNANYRTLAFLPYHHVFGFAAIFIWSHFLGYTTVYLKDRAPHTIMDTCRRCHVNQLITVPLLVNNISRGIVSAYSKKGRVASAVMRLMESASVSVQAVANSLGMRFANVLFSRIQKELLGTDIKCIVLGGSGIDPESLRRINAIGYYTTCGFGMTETTINSIETRTGLCRRINGSVGQPFENTEYRIKECEGGSSEIGELMVKSMCVHDGVYVDGKMMPPKTDADGWFSTGDIAKISGPGKGVYILGRVKDLIINESGENVYPDELELCFNGLNGVEQLSIVGTAKKGTRYEDITLVMCVGSKISDDSLINDLETEVIRINKTLPVYKRLTRVLVCQQKLPSTSTMKVKRVELRKNINAGTIQYQELDIKKKKMKPETVDNISAKQETSDKVRSQMADIFAEVLGVQPSSIDPDANIIENLGGDSLQVLSIVSKVEETFGIVIPSESYVNCMTVNDACVVIERLIRGESDNSSLRQLVERAPVVSFEDSEEYKNFKERIDTFKSDGIKNPYFVCHDSPLLDTSLVEGREMLDFGNYNYVGMSGRKEVSEAAKKAIDMYGTSASGSRLLAGERPVHGELERELAEWKHAEKALVCVGGHSTNVTLVGNFCGNNDLILYDALAHNSVEQGCRLSQAASRPFPHNDIAALEKILVAQRKYYEKVLIIVEGVYSMDGDIAPIPDFVAIKKKYGCFLMVDEAHSACVLGATGGGVDEYFGLAQDDIDIKMGTLSKGLGTCGGYIAGKASLVDYLKYNLPGFVFSVGMSPALAAGSLKAVRLLRTHPEIMQRLHSNIKCFADEAKKRKLDICLGGNAAVIPILVGRDEDAFIISNELEKHAILVPPAVYPAVPRNKARLRFDVISEHKPEQIIKALDTLVKVAAELHIDLPKRDY